LCEWPTAQSDRRSQSRTVLTPHVVGGCRNRMLISSGPIKHQGRVARHVPICESRNTNRVFVNTATCKHTHTLQTPQRHSLRLLTHHAAAAEPVDTLSSQGKNVSIDYCGLAHELNWVLQQCGCRVARCLLLTPHARRHHLWLPCSTVAVGQQTEAAFPCLVIAESTLLAQSSSCNLAVRSNWCAPSTLQTPVARVSPPCMGQKHYL
jgi:hypothetical protein